MIDKIICELKTRWSSLIINIPGTNKNVVNYETIHWLESWLKEKLTEFQKELIEQIENNLPKEVDLPEEEDEVYYELRGRNLAIKGAKYILNKHKGDVCSN